MRGRRGAGGVVTRYFCTNSEPTTRMKACQSVDGKWGWRRRIKSIFERECGSLIGAARETDRRRVVRDGLGEHCLPRAGGAVEQYAPRRIYADLCIEVVVCERQLHSLPDFLLLLVAPGRG